MKSSNTGNLRCVAKTAGLLYWCLCALSQNASAAEDPKAPENQWSESESESVQPRGGSIILNPSELDAAKNASDKRSQADQAEAEKKGVVLNVKDVWAIIGETQLNQLDLDAPVGSLNIGLEYATSFHELLAIVNLSQGGDSKETLDRGSAALGQLILAPTLVKFGGALSYKYFFNSGIYCPNEDYDKVTKTCRRNIHRGIRGGLYLGTEFGGRNITISNETDDDGAITNPGYDVSIVSSRTFLGVVGEVNSASTPSLGISMYLVGSARIASGDLTGAIRQDLFGTEQVVFPGGDLGIELTLAQARLGVSLNAVYSNKAIAGLSGLHVTPSVAFSLPLSILGTVSTPVPENKKDGGKAAPKKPALAKAVAPVQSGNAPSGAVAGQTETPDLKPVEPVEAETGTDSGNGPTGADSVDVDTTP